MTKPGQKSRRRAEGATAKAGPTQMKGLPGLARTSPIALSPVVSKDELVKGYEYPLYRALVKSNLSRRRSGGTAGLTCSRFCRGRRGGQSVRRVHVDERRRGVAVARPLLRRHLPAADDHSLFVRLLTVRIPRHSVGRRELRTWGYASRSVVMG